MPRAFVAIRPPPPVLDAIAARVAAVALSPGRAAPRDQWHLTVQFLGDEADLAAIATVFELDPVRLDAAAVRLGGAEALGNRRRARILALGLQEGADWVRRLAAQVERRLVPLGYERDDRDRPFRPHLTLARFRAPTDLRPLCGDIGSDPVGPAWRVDEMVLYESVLQPGGAQHTARARLPIGP